ncbi:gluconate 2-dehydrogenase subunit 3 family protein [Mucilaginibacter sp. L196]|uniref:gluconate 2-dehydrogenase subunit 3 family protein n=1 Tax=Mucilaginibacter sp. L196 TaxID=1641870 RepID=UPI00131AA26E|nr:gluconate 2-dehydrogenase subunit 3 family protein [Mucilaginibacter sp. L196]
MNRRESLRTLAIGAAATGLLLDASCKPGTQKVAEVIPPKEAAPDPSRLPNEIARDKKLSEEKFFTDHEMATITVLVDIIIPKDEKSGSASDAKVPEFIAFIVNDMPEHQTPLRGGLRWLDVQCLNRYNTTFRDASAQQQIDMVKMIAYPKKAKPEMAQGVAFFSRMRDLTATGFFTSEMGVKDIGYVGNSPTIWTGVPADVLKSHGFDTVWG